MEPINNAPLLLLRNQNKSFKSRQKRLDKRVKCKQQLRQQIYSNHQIFHSNIDICRNMNAQNIIWDKNYTFKCLINQVKNDNSSLKARIWNLEKENRKMERQIETWNLPQHHKNQYKKPYVDLNTVETVLQDQDYQIVSMKMEIAKLETQLQERVQEHNKITQQINQTPQIIRMLNHEIALKKVEMHRSIGGHETYQKDQGQLKDKFSQKLMAQNQQLEQIQRNIQLKKKSKQSLQNQINALDSQISLKTVVSQQEIEELVFATRQMKAEQDGGLYLEKQKTRKAIKATKQFECQMQEAMDKFIEKKISIQAEINSLKIALI